MNLNSFNPRGWFRRKDAMDSTRNQGGMLALSQRESNPMGAWSGVIGQWEPRAKSPYLYEALREAIPILDGGINRLVTLDGILTVEGDNDALVQEIDTWMRNVPVNDLEYGYQAFYAAQGAEHYEQGVGVGEFVYDKRGRDVIGLRVADSKGIAFVRDTDRMRVFYRAPLADRDLRPDGLGAVEQLLSGTARGDVISGLVGYGYNELEPRQCVFALHRPEADNPYGTSMPFVAQILLKMENASGRAWERFGDPSFHVHYSTKNRKVDSAEADRRARTIAQDLAKALQGKARGNSVDLSTAAALDDDVKVEIIGANGLVLEIEAPARHMLEQIVAGFGLPGWMLGVTWSQAAGIGEQQSVIVLQESQTRFELREPQLRRPIEAMLRARGRTWKPGDWNLVQVTPNLMDIQKRAQSEFLNAQTAMMLSESGQSAPSTSPRGVDNNLRASRGRPSRKTSTKAADDADPDGGESWAQPDPALPALELATTEAMLATWALLGDDVLELLGLAQPGEDAFAFAADTLAPMLVRGNAAQATIAQSLLKGQTGAWERGIANAGLEVSANFGDDAVRQAIAAARERMRISYSQRGLELVRPGFARTYQRRIVGALTAGEFDGQNPVNVAAALRDRFGGGEYNWERLATSEIAMAQSDGKIELLRQQGVTQYDYETAGDSKVSRICRELAEAGPYVVGGQGAPIPVRDSHPNCRCTIMPRA
jgi:SPP1 gp7 family putative phage head morphogenesis protein